ncbi:MAG: trehalose-phosphatase [Dongiaceae bacterium]
MDSERHISWPPPLADVQKPGLFLDFDGTLVELAAGPQAVSLSGRLGDLLPALALKLQGAAAIVSGRPVEQLRRLLPLGIPTIVGLHGAETWYADGRHDRIPVDQALRDVVQRRLEDFAGRARGVLFEDKGSNYALHFRAAPEQAGACHAIVEALAAESAGALCVRPGNMVVELGPAGIDKGTAVSAIMGHEPFAGRRPVFVGDDLTDEDGFAASAAMGGFGILVGPMRPTHASARLESVNAVRAWLTEFVR